MAPIQALPIPVAQPAVPVKLVAADMGGVEAYETPYGVEKKRTLPPTLTFHVPVECVRGVILGRQTELPQSSIDRLRDSAPPKVEESEEWASRVRPEVAAFAQAMEAQLKANDHKPGWKSDSLDSLHRRLIEEADELLEEIDKDAWTPEGVTREAADVANFAMMLADRCGGLKLRPAIPETKKCCYCENEIEPGTVVCESCVPKPPETKMPTEEEVREALAPILFNEVYPRPHGPQTWAACDDWTRKQFRGMARACLAYLKSIGWKGATK